MEIIYATRNGYIEQSDQLHCYFLHFKGVSYQMAPCSLIALKAKLCSYNLDELLMGDDDLKLEIIPVCNRDRFLILELPDLIEVKELISGTFVMLELNSIMALANG
ncbi:MAG: hypothetical protein AAFO69_15000 [Bacteroidota bacterium]